jgi:hypothetical protein
MGRCRAILLVLAPALFAIATPACARGRFAEGAFERTLAVTGPVDLEVVTGAGSLLVRAGDSGSVRVSGTIRARVGWGESLAEAEGRVRAIESSPPIVQEGNRIAIGRLEREDLGHSVSISYEVVVPRETRLRSRTGSGSQRIEALRGPVEASTGSGSMTFLDIGGEVRASSGSGGIEARAIAGSFSASTGSGAIRATGLGGRIRASAGSGSVFVESAGPGEVEVETGSGSVEVRGARGELRIRTGSGSIRAEGRPAGPWILHTSSGEIGVRLPEDTSFTLQARTSSGRIETRHPIAVQGRVGRQEVAGDVRGGGPLVDLSTGSGSIRIF